MGAEEPVSQISIWPSQSFFFIREAEARGPGSGQGRAGGRTERDTWGCPRPTDVAGAKRAEAARSLAPAPHWL